MNEMSKANYPTAPPPLRKITLSEAAHELALELSLLPVYAEFDRPDAPETVAQAIWRINRLLEAFSEPMREQGDRFATIGSPGDTVTILQRAYPSAHHAAIGEVHRLMDWLWFHLDERGYNETTKRSLSRIASSERDSALKQKAKGTGLDPRHVVENWPRAKAGILELMPHTWRVAFNAIDARIARERAAVRPAGIIEYSLGNSDPDRCLIPLKYRTREMTKSEAARHLGYRKADGANLARRVTALVKGIQVKEGRLVAWSRTRQRWIFDYRIFPKSSWKEIR